MHDGDNINTDKHNKYCYRNGNEVLVLLIARLIKYKISSSQGTFVLFQDNPRCRLQDPPKYDQKDNNISIIMIKYVSMIIVNTHRFTTATIPLAAVGMDHVITSQSAGSGSNCNVTRAWMIYEVLTHRLSARGDDRLRACPL